MSRLLTRSYVSVLFIVLISLSLVTALALMTPTYAETAKTKRIIWKRVTIEQVPEAIGKDIDIYLFGLRPAQAIQMLGRKDVKLYKAPAGLVDYILNPAPVQVLKLSGKYDKKSAAEALGVAPIAISYIAYNETEDKTLVELCVKAKKIPAGAEKIREAEPDINIFCFREIRFAVNYLIDRKAIVEQIYRGLAIPMYTHYSPADPTYTVVLDIVAKYRFTKDVDYAKKVFEKVLTAIGAEYKNGKWYYNGKPITITFIIRVEDERRELGHLLASELEKLGITVNAMELTFGEAITRVYATCPEEFQWHIYTEGWGRGAIDRWDPWMLAQFAAPWFGWMPGWQYPQCWQYKNETIDKYSRATALGLVKSKEQWIDYIRKGTELAIQESIRIWIAATLTSYVTVTELKGVTLDLGAGLRNTIFNARNWYIPGKDTIRVGHLWVWTARTVWNPYGGFDDVYSVDPMRATWDPWIWRHPFNGEPMGVRVTFEVETAGPEGKLDVPPDAMIWDAKNDKWVKVGEGVKVTSKVVFDLSKLIGTHWHHGITITWADILGHYALLWDLTYDPEKSKLEASIAAVNKEILDLIKGIRPLYDEKKLEIYIDYWHFDPAYIADMAVIPIYIPLELDIALNILAFEKKTYALDETRARAQGIPQVSMVIPEHAKDIKATLEEMLNRYDDFKLLFTDADGKVLMTPDEWKARIEAAIAWIEKYGIAWISDGPFKLVKFDKDAQVLELEAFDDPTYPIKPEDLYFGIPTPVEILDVRVEGIPYIGRDTIIRVEVAEQPRTHVLYVLSDPATRTVVAFGEAVRVEAGVYRITIPADVTKKLKPEHVYELEVLAYSEEVTLPSSVTRIVTFSIPPTEIVHMISEVQKGMQEQIAGVSEKVAKQIEEIRKEFTARTEEISKSVEERIAALREEMTSKLEGVSKTVAEALTKSTEEMTKVFKELISSLDKSIRETFAGLKDTMDTGFKGVRDTITSGLGTISASIKALDDRIKDVESSVTDLSKKVTTISDALDELSKKVDSLSGAISTVTALIIVAIILSIISIAVAFIRRK